MASTASEQPATGTSNGQPKKPMKPSLKEPERIEMIKTHRGLLSTMGSMHQLLRITGSSAPKEPVFLKTVPAGLKPVYVKNMDPEQEWVFKNRVVHLTLIEEPMLGFTPIHQIAEDKNGDSIQVFIHEVPQNKKMCDLLCYGQRIAVISPYMRIALDGRHGIKVEDPSTIVILGKKKDMCRYCGTENAPHKCGKCHTARYCSRECQVEDWKELDHKRICHKIKGN